MDYLQETPDVEEVLERDRKYRYSMNFRNDDEKPDYNAPKRMRAIEELLEYICGDIELLEGYEKDKNAEKRQLFREYEFMLNKMREFKGILQRDYSDAHMDYQAHQDYYDSIDDD